ncbi:ABC transporter substrate-binding protein [Helicobacter sp. T3_23-1059]
MTQNLPSLTEKEQRLIVLDPASIEIIYLLGKGESIKAIASMQHSHIYPQEQTSKLASVGSFSNPSVEKILSLKPNLVILSLYSLGLQERLENLGIKTAYLEANRLEDMYENIAKLASLLGVEQRGAELILKTKQEIESLRKEASFKGKSAVFLYSSNPLMAFNDNSVIADILRVLGLENKTISTNVARPILSNEFLLKANPDMLILGVQANDISALIAQNPALKNLKAYKNGAILTYPKAHRLLRVSPTIVDGIKELKSMLEQGTK